VLEGFNMGARRGRGRAYARDGQALSIEIEKGQVTAKVQGSRPRPYHVVIGGSHAFRGWQCVVEALSRQAIFAALAGCVILIASNAG